MTTKTQTKPKPKTKKSASSLKSKKALSTKRTTPKPNKKSPQLNKPAARPLTKQATIRSLVARPDGATIADLTQATKWQAHSVRAALTGLRKAGSDIARTKDDDGTTRYRVKVPAQ